MSLRRYGHSPVSFSLALFAGRKEEREREREEKISERKEEIGRGGGLSLFGQSVSNEIASSCFSGQRIVIDPFNAPTAR